MDGPRTVAAWIYPTGWGEGNYGRIWDKGTFRTAGWFFYLKNDAAPLASILLVIGATGEAQATAVANTIVLNVWQFVAGTWVGTVGTNAPKLYRGTLSTPVAEVSYASTYLGSGTQGSDAALEGFIGNRGAADRTFNGPIEHPSVWDNALSLAQLDALRLRPYAPFHRFATAAGTVINLKGYWPLTESAAATCLDHSGNGSNGTVTGTTVGASAPYLWTRRGAQATIWTPAAPPTGRIWSLAGQGGGLVGKARGLGA